MKPSECPVDHEKMKKTTKEFPLKKGECPVDHDKENPKNLMELKPLQKKYSGQKIDLDTDRVKSTIPKAEGDEGETWEYPSPQMFYNAMKRKGWNPEETDMPYIVAIHNTMNEKAWNEIKKYEEMHSDV